MFPAPFLMSPSRYRTLGVDNGGAVYLTLGSGLTGAADDPQGLFNCWVRKDGGDGSAMRIFRSTTGSVLIQFTAANKIEFQIWDGVAANAFVFETSAIIASATWRHIVSSWDCNYGAGLKKAKIMIDGVADCTITNDVTVGFNVDYTVADWAVLATNAGASKFDGCLADLLFDDTAYLDVSQAANLALFRSSDGKPINLGDNGELPLGTTPIVFQRVEEGGAASAFLTNRGLGGNWTENGGSLALASTNPTD